MALLKALESLTYRIVTTTPSSHERVLSVSERREARSLREVMGWSLPFAPGMIPSEIVDLLRAGGVLQEWPGGLVASDVRACLLGGMLFLHSANPTIKQEAVFFGPDSDRFAALASARKLAQGECLIPHTGVSIVEDRGVLEAHLEEALPALVAVSGITSWIRIPSVRNRATKPMPMLNGSQP